MKKTTKNRSSVAAAAGISFLFALGIMASPLDVSAAESPVTLKIMPLAGMDAEMPPVGFNHETHLAKLQKAGKDCRSCHPNYADPAHLTDGRGFAVTTGRIRDKDDFKKAWHDACFDCHRKYFDAPKAASCKSCHDSQAADNGRLPVKFDRSLHAAHVKSKLIAPVVPANAKEASGPLGNCGACHSTVDAKGNSVYMANTGDAASFYKTDSTDKRVLASVAHNTCVSCHAEIMAKDKAAGGTLALPQLCGDCHSAEGQLKFPKGTPQFRLLRGQPDSIVLAENADTQKNSPSGAAIKSVPFDHKRHEAHLDCAVCHGVKIEAAADGAKKALSYDAAHNPQAAGSCVGCHAKTVAEDKNCSGCHSVIKAGGLDSCNVCHKGASAPISRPSDMSSKASGKASVSAKDIPETVTISDLSKGYKAVELPHRKIYESMLKGMEKNGLAEAFHKEATCRACHHAIPDGNITNPPSCASCHDKEVKAVAPGDRPNLRAAYHQMCITCHSNMGVKPAAQDCSGCHEPVENAKTNKKREVRK